MYSPVPSSQIVEALVHLRELFRRVRPSSERELLAFERREAITKDFLSNLPRSKEHPTLRTVLEIANINSLTLEGAHKLFGYSLENIRLYDRNLNNTRTHILELYPFERDLLIELPSRLAPAKSFDLDSSLRDLVLEWQSAIPLRAIEEEGWEPPGTYYVQVGTGDSLGSSIPPGALCLVEPIGEREEEFPNPRNIYLLQFGNGYRCSHCVVSNGKLQLFSTARRYLGREEFAYPHSVRIAGRIRMFALGLPMPGYPVPASLPKTTRGGDLILPWEHQSRDQLLLAEHRRFKRPQEEVLAMYEFLTERLQANLSGRSERRYRRPTSSDPHVNALIHLSLTHMARYTDTLRTGRSWQTDRERYSLDTLLRARSFEETRSLPKMIDIPTPREVWNARRKEYGGWPTLLSVRFPTLQHMDNKVVRLAQGAGFAGLDPALGPGTLLLLNPSQPEINLDRDRAQFGWSRPIYLLRRGVEIFCGHLEKSGDQYALLAGVHPTPRVVFPAADLAKLSLVSGVAVPV